MIVKLIMSNTVRSSAKERQVSGYRVEPWFAHMVCAPPFILFFCTIKQDIKTLKWNTQCNSRINSQQIFIFFSMKC